MAMRFIKEAREDLGLTQEQLALKLRISPGYMSQLENGARPLTPDLGLRTARALKCRPSDLHAGQDVMRRLAAAKARGVDVEDVVRELGKASGEDLAAMKAAAPAGSAIAAFLGNLMGELRIAEKAPTPGPRESSWRPAAKADGGMGDWEGGSPSPQRSGGFGQAPAPSEGDAPGALPTRDALGRNRTREVDIKRDAHGRRRRRIPGGVPAEQVDR